MREALEDSFGRRRGRPARPVRASRRWSRHARGLVQEGRHPPQRVRRAV